MMLVEETTIPSAALPVGPFKDHLRLGTGFADDGLQDTVLESFLRAAMAAIEARTGKILLSREFSWSLNHWRNTDAQPLPIAPVSQLLAVDVEDVLGTVTALPLSDYVLERDHQRPHVIPKIGRLPNIPNRGSVNLRFIAGFSADFDALPADISQAVLLLAAHYYENRSAVGIPDTSMPFGVSVLVERYKTVRILGGRI